MKLDSGSDLKQLKVDGGMTNGDLTMSILADIGGFSVIRPEMREYVLILLLHLFLFFSGLDNTFLTHTHTHYRSTALGSAICAGAAIKLFGWDLKNPESLKEVNTKGSREFRPNLQEAQREKKWQGWQKAVERSRGWEEGVAT